MPSDNWVCIIASWPPSPISCSECAVLLCRFFCAMDPAMRKKWAQAWSSWLQPGGEVVTLMFPVESEGREGPPWPVPVELYDDTLKLEGLYMSLNTYQHNTCFHRINRAIWILASLSASHWWIPSFKQVAEWQACRELCSICGHSTCCCHMKHVL